jgi:hypothetical protein
VWEVEGEDSGPQPAHRACHDVDCGQLEGVEDFAKERARVVEQIDTAVVERLRQAMAGAIHGEHASVTGQRREDRHPVESGVQAAMEQKERGTGAGLQYLRLALRPGHSADMRLGRVARKQSGLCGLKLVIRIG